LFTAFLPILAARLLRGYRARSEHRCMADLLVVVAIAGFVAAMLGLAWALERI
jgi:hypothetical protein